MLPCVDLIPWPSYSYLTAIIYVMFHFIGIACRYTSPLQGIGEHVKTIHKHGCRNVACNEKDLFDAATDAAREADATVLVMGLDQSVEAETRDREVLVLPGRQAELVSKVAEASKGPVVLVLMCGGPVDVSFAKNDHRVAAILWAGYPGQAGGKAIADVIFGEFNPGTNTKISYFHGCCFIPAFVFLLSFFVGFGVDPNFNLE